MYKIPHNFPKYKDPSQFKKNHHITLRYPSLPQRNNLHPPYILPSTTLNPLAHSFLHTRFPDSHSIPPGTERPSQSIFQFVKKIRGDLGNTH